MFKISVLQSISSSFWIVNKWNRTSKKKSTVMNCSVFFPNHSLQKNISTYDWSRVLVHLLRHLCTLCPCGRGNDKDFCVCPYWLTPFIVKQIFKNPHYFMTVRLMLVMQFLKKSFPTRGNFWKYPNGGQDRDLFMVWYAYAIRTVPHGRL